MIKLFKRKNRNNNKQAHNKMLVMNLGILQRVKMVNKNTFKHLLLLEHNLHRK